MPCVDEEIEALRRKITSPKLHSWRIEEPVFKAKLSIYKTVYVLKKCFKCILLLIFGYKGYLSPTIQRHIK